MDHLIQRCPFKTPNALYQIYRMPHSMRAIMGRSVCSALQDQATEHYKTERPSTTSVSAEPLSCSSSHRVAKQQLPNKPAVALFFVRLLFSSLLEDCMVESRNTSVYPTHSQSFGKSAVLTIPV